MPAEPVIEAAGVSKRYGDVQALDGVSVVVDAPATGLLGANGAGKSTLMKSLLGLVRPDAGTIRVLGIDAGHGSRELRVRLGYMPEHDCLPTGMTAHDMVVHLAEMRGLSRRDATLRASEVLFQVGLEEERARLIGTYSTGMKQRAKLAQALVHDPDLVVLDEPTNGLDPAGRVEMISLVRRLSRDLGIKVLLSSHVLEDVERTCDAVVVLRAGQVVAADRIEGMARSEEGTVEVRVAGDAGSPRRPADGRRRRSGRAPVRRGARDGRRRRHAGRGPRRGGRRGRRPARADECNALDQIVDRFSEGLAPPEPGTVGAGNRRLERTQAKLATEIEIMKAENNALRGAELFWVARDMVDVSMDAASTLPEWTPALVTPSPSGLLCWAKPAGTVPYGPKPASTTDVPWDAVFWWTRPDKMLQLVPSSRFRRHGGR